MKTGILLILIGISTAAAVGQNTPTWRYYRVGNTGIQGDYNEAIWIDPEGNPYIGGYDPSFEEGGFAIFLRGENRWVNFSNVDFPVIGHPESTGTTRVRDIVADAAGGLWMGTGRGALYYDPAVGSSSLVRYDRNNSALPGGWTTDVDIAPDGTVWFVGYSTVWGGGGLTRYDPSSHQWAYWEIGGDHISVQPKPGGGYWVWTGPAYWGTVWRFDSATGIWTEQPFTGTPGEVAGLPGKDCVDDAGNFWALRLRQPGEYEALDVRTPDGTWISPPAPYDGATFSINAFKAYGNGKALLTDGSGTTWRFDGTAWINLGAWRSGGFTYAVDIDTAGNVWASGVGGAGRRDAVTGSWQRYRITNTGHFDNFTRDLTIDAEHDFVYAGANAGPGVGGMTRFDGKRWVGWNNSTYGLGFEWPFQNDNCHTLTYRPSNSRLAVSPLSWLYGIHEWTGAGFSQINGIDGAQRLCEDGTGRLWALGEYFSLKYHNGTTWNSVPIAGWGSRILSDPGTAGTIWAATGNEIVRTNGTDRFSRTIGDFPELTTQSDFFSGFAADTGGITWIGCTVQYGAGGTGGGLIRLNASTGTYQMLRYDQGWPFPGQFVTPWVVTPDGRVWMQYDTPYPYTQRGLCWWDGTHVGSFPAPPGGEPQWGGLPHAQIEDVEVRRTSSGYELWMTCVSRGIAVLSVPATTTDVREEQEPAVFALEQNYPNPFNPVTSLRYSIAGTVGTLHATSLQVYDVLGRKVATLVDEMKEPGSYMVTFDGSRFASGTYFYRLTVGPFTAVKRMMLVK